jgi:hypothetical protein
MSHHLSQYENDISNLDPSIQLMAHSFWLGAVFMQQRVKQSLIRNIHNNE